MVAASATSRNITEVIADNTQTTVTGQLAVAYPMNHSAGYTLTDSLGTIILIPSSEGEGDLYRYNGATIEVTGNLVRQDNQRTLYMEKWVPLQAFGAEGWPTVSGAQSTLVILFQWNNLAGTNPVSYFQSLVTGASNSMTAYFDEDSYGMAWVTGGPTSQWYTLPHPSTYYNVDHWGDCSPSGDYTELTIDILDLVDPYIDFSLYVGTNKHILFVGADSYVWGCAITWGTGFLHDGVYVKHAAYISEGDPLSTYLHEFSHDLGLPDLYDYSYTDPYHFIDSWDLMSVDNAQHHSSWCKMQLGWITSSRIRTFSSGTDTQWIDRIEYTTTGYHTFKIHTSGMPANIYYLVETRQKTGFDVNIPASAPDHGVLITKIDESLGSGAGIVREVDHNPTTQQNYDGDAVWDAGDTYTNTAYGFQVIIGSWDGYGFSITVTTGGVSPPSAPVLVSPDNGANVVLPVTLSWSAVSGADLYLVGIHDGSSWILVTSTTGTSYVVPGGVLVAGHGYAWYVWARNAAGYGSPSGRAFTVVGVPAAPVLVSPDNGANVVLPVTLSWSAVSGADLYLVGIHDGSSWILVTSTTGVSYVVSDGLLVVGHSYAWYVWAHNVAGYGSPSGRAFVVVV